MRRPVAIALAAVALAAAPGVAGADGPAPIGSLESAADQAVPPRVARFLADTPAQGTGKLLASSRAGAARHKLGLPSYERLLGRGWRRRATKADARFARLGKVPPAARAKASGAAQTPTGEFESALGAMDTVRGPGGRQTRKLRVATSLDGGCPRLNELGTGYGWSGSGRATYLVTTTERIGRFDLTTSVLFDGSFRTRPEMRNNATAASFSSADAGEISITRNQFAVDRRSGKRRTLGETERFTSQLDPFYGPDGDFQAFVADQEDGSPAPRRRMRTGAWAEAAKRFMAIPYDALRGRVLEAERLARTPDACVTVAVEAPTHLAPGQTIELTGKASPTAAVAGASAPIGFAGALRAVWINPLGQSAVPLSSLERLRAGGPWYSFTAPLGPWPNSAPVGLELELVSGAGIARTPVSFRAEEPRLGFEILDASVETHTDASRPSPFCGEVGGRQTLSGSFSEQPISPDDQLTVEDGAVSGGLEAAVDMVWHDHVVRGCRADETGVETCEAAMPDRSAERWPINVSFETAPDPTELIVVWRMEDPEVGFVDAGDDECNSHVWGYLPDEMRRRTIPRSALQVNEPVTLEFAGSAHLDHDGSGLPAGIDHVWDYEITVRRLGT